MIRRTVSLARGRFSSMLDMGGVAPIKADTNSRMDMGKNNKVRSIALDFDLIARNIAHDKEEDATAPPTSSNAGRTMTVRLSQEASTVTRKITPDVGMVQSIAKLLNVKLGSDGKKKDDFAKDDLSALESPSVSGTLHDARTSSRAAKPVKFPPMSDVRDKYAEKINRKLDGGSLAGVDRAKLEKSQKKRRCLSYTGTHNRRCRTCDEIWFKVAGKYGHWKPSRLLNKSIHENCISSKAKY